MKSAKDRTRSLNTAQLDQALEILTNERKRGVFTRSNNWYFGLLVFSLFGFLIICGFIIYDMFFSFSQSIESYSSLNLILWAFLFAFLIVFFLAMNLPLMIRIWRQNRRISKMRLREILRKPYWEEWKRSYIKRASSKIALWGSYAVSGLLVLYLVYDWKSFELDYSMIIVLILLFSIVFTGYTIRMVNRNKVKLDVINRLIGTAEHIISTLDGDVNSKVSISANDYSLIAQIERAQGLRELSSSIYESSSSQEISNYSILESNKFRQTFKGLDENAKRIVEDCVDKLISRESISSSQDDEFKQERIHLEKVIATIGFKYDHKSKRLILQFLKVK